MKPWNTSSDWWMDDDMTDIWAEWGNAEAAQIIDEQATDLVRHDEVVHLLRRRTKLQLRFDLHLQPPQEPQPHRPVYSGPANKVERQRRDHAPPGFYHRQEAWKLSLDAAEFQVQPHIPVHMPMLRPLQGRPTFLVVHLFSGRRRATDFHGQLQKLCAGSPFDVAVVSMDTAVSPTLGDLRASSSSWRNLAYLYRDGKIAATLAGSPCETFTEARHHPIVLADGREVEGPRPLRSGNELWGLPRLTLREHRQLLQGSEFALQVAWCAALSVLSGGALISEHPAPPTKEERATMWRSSIMLLLRKLAEVRLHVLGQWPWGSTTPKPTGYLTVNLPGFRRAMDSWRIPHIKKPQACSMGIDPTTGLYKTAPMKEYPSHLSGGFAQAIFEKLQETYKKQRTDTHQFPEELTDWWKELCEVSARIDPLQEMRSDWQG